MKMDNFNNVVSINDISNIKKKFPILNKKIDGKTISYLDSAASSQKPQSVIMILSILMKITMQMYTEEFIN